MQPSHRTELQIERDNTVELIYIFLVEEAIEFSTHFIRLSFPLFYEIF